MSSISIRGCIFRNNRAYQGYAIYIEGENCDTSISINDHNNFINNYETANSPNGGGIIASEITSITKTSIEESSDFSNSENEGPTSEHFIHVDYSGQRLPDETPTPIPEKHLYQMKSSSLLMTSKMFVLKLITMIQINHH